VYLPSANALEQFQAQSRKLNTLAKGAGRRQDGIATAAENQRLHGVGQDRQCRWAFGSAP